MSNNHAVDYRYEVVAQEDPESGDLLVSLPPELMATLDWSEGTKLFWSTDKNGRWIVQAGGTAG